MNQITINADLGKHSISRHIYGHFSEHLGRCIYGGFWVGEDSHIPNTRGMRNDVVAAYQGLYQVASYKAQARTLLDALVEAKEEAQRQYAAGQEALRNGDFTKYGEAQKALQAAIDRAARLSGQIPAGTTGTTAPAATGPASS